MAERASTDFRDPKLVTFRAACCATSRLAGKTSQVAGTRCSLDGRPLADGRTFDQPRPCRAFGPAPWLWHVAARGDALYGTAYGGGAKAATLYRSSDGMQWEKITDFPSPCNEVYLDFAADGVLWALAAMDWRSAGPSRPTGSLRPRGAR